ncbi:hypothetical protein, partial [Lichenifustis flavocetrariae]
LLTTGVYSTHAAKALPEKDMTSDRLSDALAPKTAQARPPFPMWMMSPALFCGLLARSQRHHAGRRQSGCRARTEGESNFGKCSCVFPQTAVPQGRTAGLFTHLASGLFKRDDLAKSSRLCE